LVVFFRLSRFAIAAALAFSIGLHWEVLQSVAWVVMIVNYSQDAPLTEALAKTFDGKHPCSLCKQIAHGKQSEKKTDSVSVGKKLEFFYASGAFAFAAPLDGWEVQWQESALRSVVCLPPVPPPRQLPG
jgi:hypothetical protein